MFYLSQNIALLNMKIYTKYSRLYFSELIIFHKRLERSIISVTMKINKPYFLPLNAWLVYYRHDIRMIPFDHCKVLAIKLAECQSFLQYQ